MFGWISFFKRSTQKRVGRARLAVSFKAINRALMLGCVILVVYLALDTFTLAVSLTRPPNFVMQKDAVTDKGAAESVSTLESESSYVDKAIHRNIFQLYKEPAPTKKNNEGKEVPLVNEAVTSLSLVGISWSASPDAIVEDKSRQKTYFLKRGMTFGDGMKVTSIFKDRVVISADGEEFEIK